MNDAILNVSEAPAPTVGDSDSMPLRALSAPTETDESAQQDSAASEADAYNENDANDDGDSPDDVDSQEAPDSTEQSNEISKEDAFANKTVQNALSRKDRKINKLQQRLNTAQQREHSLNQQPAQAPQEADFVDKPYGEFLQAQAEYAADKRFNERDASTARKEVETVKAEIDLERKAHVDDSEKRVKDKLPDFDKVVDTLFQQKLPNGQTAEPFSPAAFDLLQQSDEPALAIYMIGKTGQQNALNGASSHYEAVSIIQNAIKKGQNLVRPRNVTAAPEPMTRAKGTGRGAKPLNERSSAEKAKFLFSDYS